MSLVLIILIAFGIIGPHIVHRAMGEEIPAYYIYAIVSGLTLATGFAWVIGITIGDPPDFNLLPLFLTGGTFFVFTLLSRRSYYKTRK